MKRATDDSAATDPGRVYRFADLALYPAKGELRRSGVAIPLPRLSWELLLALVEAAPAVLDQEALLARVWKGRVVNGETITQRVKLLRGALGDDAGAPRYVGLVRGRGYRLLPEVRVEVDTAHAVRRSGAARQLLLPRNLAVPALAIIAILSVPELRDSTTMAPTADELQRRALDRVPAKPERSLAEEAFLKGRYFYNRRQPGDFARAREELKKAVALDPEHTQAWVTLAASYYIGHYEQGELEEQAATEAALSALRRALELDPASARAHARMAHVLFSIGEQVAAGQHFRLARKHGSDDALVLAIIAGKHADSGNYRLAADLLLRATRLEPLAIAHRANLMSIYLAGHMLEDAEREIEELDRLFPDMRERFAWESAVLALLRERPARALEHAARLTEAGDRHAMTAMAAYHAGNMALAEQALARLRRAKGLQASVRRIVALAYLGRHSEMQRSIDALEELADTGQLTREARRWAWSELATSPLAPDALRPLAQEVLNRYRLAAVVDS
jgi:DNA-binding winged helix-turn-helix (wHTH) protein/Flp pilus assembly protein TadD